MTTTKRTGWADDCVHVWTATRWDDDLAVLADDLGNWMIVRAPWEMTAALGDRVRLAA